MWIFLSGDFYEKMLSDNARVTFFVFRPFESPIKNRIKGLQFYLCYCVRYTDCSSNSVAKLVVSALSRALSIFTESKPILSI